MESLHDRLNLLQDIDMRQDSLLNELDQLNQRVEALIKSTLIERPAVMAESEQN